MAEETGGQTAAGSLIVVAGVFGGNPDWLVRLAVAHPDGTVSEDDGDVITVTPVQAAALRGMLARVRRGAV